MEDGTSARPGRGQLRQAGYELLCQLGQGGMGEVWAAARIGVEGAIKPCAIKVIRPVFADDARYRELFVAEGRLAMMLSHANIVSVFDVGVVGGRLFMAMEWVDGVDLGTFWRRVQQAAGGQPLAVPEAMHVVGALLDAVGYAHDFSVAGCEQGVVHRDISPGNAMITSRGEVKLMDFGLAGLGPGIGDGAGPRLRGTLRYLSREQARGRPEAASDLFAIGAILHELLEGQKFRRECEDDQALIASIFEGGIPRLQRRVPEVIESLRRGLLEPRVELRIKTARQALTTLASWPGYRNRRLQLESLYRQVFGEPRSGLTQLLSLGVRSELLDELRRRIEDEGQGTVEPRVSQATVPYVVSSRASQPEASASQGAGVTAGESQAVVRARSTEQVMAHRVASSTAGTSAARGSDDEALEREDTEPWPRSPRGSLDESATAWLAPSGSEERWDEGAQRAARESSIGGAGSSPSRGWPGAMAMRRPLASLGLRRWSPNARGRRVAKRLVWAVLGGLSVWIVLAIARGGGS
ncbi:MAG: serine/threonine-protein kinase [Myxococcota bacterium]